MILHRRFICLVSLDNTLKPHFKKRVGLQTPSPAATTIALFQDVKQLRQNRIVHYSI